MIQEVLLRGATLREAILSVVTSIAAIVILYIVDGGTLSLLGITLGAIVILLLRAAAFYSHSHKPNQS